MRRLLSIVTSILLLFSVGVQGQSTLPSSSTFSIKDAPEGWPISYTNPHFQWYSIGDTLIHGIDVDIDSLTRVLGGQETEWILKIVAYDSTKVCEGDTITQNGVVYLGTATLEYSKIEGDIASPKKRILVPIPKNLRPNNTTLVPGLTIRFDKGVNISIGSSVHLKYYTHELLFSREGAQSVYSNPPRVDSLTISGRDTLSPGAFVDTLYTKAFPGRFGYITIVIEADSAIIAFLGRQSKYNGGSWTGPLDSLIAFTPVLDSVIVTSALPRSYMPAGTALDSSRFILINKSIYRGLLKSFKIFWRD